MAKKSPSTSKKPTKKLANKPAKKLTLKSNSGKPGKTAKTGKANKAEKPKKPVKAIAKSLPKKEVKPLKAVKPEPVKVEKKDAVKPALMTKKGKLIEAEEVTEEIAAPIEELTPTKAEKVSKVKPIRIEKGNIDDEKAKWAELFKKYGKDKAINYKMSDTFSPLSPVQHKVLGWGFILKSDNDRLEVLFETGIRMLISNYKA